MTLAHGTAASTDVVAPGARSRNRGRRLRTCAECGKVEEIRADNPASRCRPCATRPALAQGHRARSAQRNHETCRHCGRVFPAPPSSRQQFCSRACRRAAQSVERTCVTCGGSFRIARSILSDRTNSSGRFCSRSCYERHLCRTPRIRGRGSRWKTIRKAALRQTPFCACCGKTRHLQVHHIIPFRLTRDNSPTNLIPLCRACRAARRKATARAAGSTSPSWRATPKASVNRGLRSQPTLPVRSRSGAGGCDHALPDHEERA